MITQTDFIVLLVGCPLITTHALKCILYDFSPMNAPLLSLPFQIFIRAQGGCQVCVLQYHLVIFLSGPRVTHLNKSPFDLGIIT